VSCNTSVQFLHLWRECSSLYPSLEFHAYAISSLPPSPLLFFSRQWHCMGHGLHLLCNTIERTRLGATCLSNVKKRQDLFACARARSTVALCRFLAGTRNENRFEVRYEFRVTCKSDDPRRVHLPVRQMLREGKEGLRQHVLQSRQRAARSITNID